LLGKGAPRAAEDRDADRRQLDDAIDALQQRAVVAGDEYAALPAFEHLRHGQPSVDVEIVGRLVQQQQVRRLDQETRERHPCALAAAQVSDRAIQRQIRQAGFHQRGTQPGFQRPVGLRCIVQRAVAMFEPPQAREIAGDAKRLTDGLALVRKLGEHADRAWALNRSARRFDSACDQMQQRRLATAIASDEAGPLTPQRKRQSVEQLASVRRNEGNGIQNNKRGHGELPKWTGFAER
jgi:hypothetical protein